MKLLIISLRQALRSMQRHAWQTAISVFGFVLGMASFTYSANWLWNETHHDSFRPNGDKTYMVQYYSYDDSAAMANNLPPRFVWSVVSYPFYRELQRRLPADCKLFAMINSHPTVKISETEYIDIGTGYSVRNPLAFVQEAGFKCLHGSFEATFANKGTVAISRSTAQKVFGRENVIGDTLRFQGGYSSISMPVQAVYEDVPPLSNWDFNLLADIGSLNTVDTTEWGHLDYKLFVITDRPDELAKTVGGIKRTDSYKTTASTYKITPLRTAHLMGQRPETEFWAALVYPLTFFGFSLLLLCCAVFNYIAILSSIYLGRLREYTLRMSLGSTFGQNALWIVTEVALTLLLSTFLSAIAVELMGQLSDETDASVGIFGMLGYVAILTMLLVALGLAYPLLRLRHTYRAQFSGTPANRNVHTSLVAVQFFVCFLLLFCLTGAARQIYMALNAPLGFDTENILRINTDQRTDPNLVIAREKYDAIAALLENTSSPYIKDVLPIRNDIFEKRGFNGAHANAYFAGIDDELKETMIYRYELPYEAFAFFNLKMRKGSWVSEQKPQGIAEYILNPEAEKLLRLENMEEGRLHDSEGRTIRLQGIAGFRTKSVREKEKPQLYLIRREEKEFYGYNNEAIYVRHAPGTEKQAREEIVRTMKDLGLGDHSICIERLDDRIASFYREDAELLRIFAIVTVFCLATTLCGVLSMVLYSLRLKRRSIAIRRVFGAGEGTLVMQQLRAYLIYAMLASAVAYPVAKWLTDLWLETYAVRIHAGALQGGIILLGIMVLVALVVSLQVYRFLREKPVDVLEKE